MEEIKHNLVYSFPGGQLHAQANSFEELESVISEQLAAILNVTVSTETDDIDKAALKAYRFYKASRYSGDKKPNRTSLESAGVEVDAIRCYLSGMTGKATIKKLKIDRGVYLGKSAVGRFFRDLFECKIYPLKRVKR